MKLPTDASGDELVKALQRIGFVVSRQKGSRIILKRSEPYRRVVVPNHKSIRPGTLRHILDEAGITVEEFLKLR